MNLRLLLAFRLCSWCLLDAIISVPTLALEEEGLAAATKGDKFPPAIVTCDTCQGDQCDALSGCPQNLNQCTRTICSDLSCECEEIPLIQSGWELPGCCMSNSYCHDITGNRCTICSDNRCVHNGEKSCCEIALDCVDRTCMDKYCNYEERDSPGVCVHVTPAGKCSKDSDCVFGGLTGTCDVTTCQCQFGCSKLAGDQCEADEDCGITDECSIRLCDKDTCTCTGIDNIPNCCRDRSECQGDDPLPLCQENDCEENQCKVKTKPGCVCTSDHDCPPAREYCKHSVCRAGECNVETFPSYCCQRGSFSHCCQSDYDCRNFDGCPVCYADKGGFCSCADATCSQCFT